MVAAIRPQGKPEGVWALPKGNVDPGESPAETAVREVWEETGVQGTLLEKLGDVKYVYTRRDGERTFKIVSFFLLRYRSGSVENHDHEVDALDRRARRGPFGHCCPLRDPHSVHGKESLATRALTGARIVAITL